MEPADNDFNEDENFNFKLINAIKRHPVIYAKGSKIYRNVGEKDKAWREVANDLKISESEAKKKWRNIRDRFVKEHRRVIKTSSYGAGADDMHESKWPLYEELEFLAAHCEKRPFAETKQ